MIRAADEKEEKINNDSIEEPSPTIGPTRMDATNTLNSKVL